MVNYSKGLILVLIGLVFVGCANLSRSEKATLSELRAYGISDTVVSLI